MRDPDVIRRDIDARARALHAAVLLRNKCDLDTERVIALLRRVDTERATADRQIEIYHAQVDALMDELTDTYIAQAEAMVQT